jgi:SHS2 domain-containing protein
MRKKYNMLEHTADIGFEAFGDTREEALANAATALVSLITDPDQIRTAGTREFSVAGDDWEQFLVRYLNEILYIIDAESFVPADATVTPGNGCTAHVVLRGESRSQRHEIRTDVKAITYHQLRFDETETGYYIRLFVDI